VGERQAVLALGQLGQDTLLLGLRAAAGDQAAAQAHVDPVGLHHEALAERLHDQHHVHRVAAEAPVFLREGHAEEAHLGEGRPDRLAPAGGRIHDLGPRVDRVLVGQVTLEAVGQELLLFAQIEVHSPSVAFAMMFRWISLEPA
jgi:hypothetical protein